MINCDVCLRKTTHASLQHSSDTRAACNKFLAKSARHDLPILSGNIKKLMKDSPVEFAIYANVRQLVAPAICALALLASFCLLRLLLKLSLKPSLIMFYSQNIANFDTLSTIKLFVLLEIMGELLHHDVLM